MAHKKPKYDAACYHGNVLLGRCTVADSEAFSVMMESCGGNAARVMREYAYFSPELKMILEKAVALQAKQNQRESLSGIFAPPTVSPWGEVDYSDTLCPGVFLVSTMGHGGVMVSKDMEMILSPAARKHGQRKNGYLCFEEDTEESIVLRELLDKKLWEIPERIQDKSAFEEGINKTLKEYHPEYWRSRENGRRQALPVKAAPSQDER